MQKPMSDEEFVDLLVKEEWVKRGASYIEVKEAIWKFFGERPEEDEVQMYWEILNGKN